MARANLAAVAALEILLLSGCPTEVERSQESVDHLLQTVLGRVQSEPKYLPDRGLLPADGPLLVREEIDDSAFQVTGASLPSGKFVIRTRAELQQEANASGQELFFIEIGGVGFRGNEATLTLGVGYAVPEGQGRAMLCCCSRTDSYAYGWHDGRWAFSQSIGAECS